MELTDKKIIRKIENLYVKELREECENLSDITVEDVYIHCFYGVYRNSYVVVLDYGSGTTEILPADMEIDGVVFHFGHYRYMDSARTTPYANYGRDTPMVFVLPFDCRYCCICEVEIPLGVVVQHDDVGGLYLHQPL